MNLDESYVDRPNRHRTVRNHRFLNSGHRDIGHGHRLIAFSCGLGNGCHRGGNRRLGVVNPMTVDARYPYYDRIDARPIVSSYFEARSGKLGPMSFSGAYCIRIVRPYVTGNG